MSMNVESLDNYELRAPFTSVETCVYICTKLEQRRRRWADVVQLLHRYFVFVGYC